MTSRPPAVAGMFYPARPDELRRQVDELTVLASPTRVLGCVAPHAGYTYSGPTAGKTFGRIEVPDVVVVLSPNHTGRGRPMALHPGGAWDTPVGAVQADPELAKKLRDLDPDLAFDVEAHEDEHGIEVELPFLLKRNPKARLVAVVLATRERASLEKLGRALAEFARTAAPGALVVASSDMNHFESDAVTRAKDRKAIERLLARDGEGLLETCLSERISMCGVGPAVAMLACAKELKEREAALVDYRTSADASGDMERCVGYAGVVVR